MKKIYGLILIVCVMLTVCSCGIKDEPIYGTYNTVGIFEDTYTLNQNMSYDAKGTTPDIDYAEKGTFIENETGFKLNPTKSGFMYSEFIKVGNYYCEEGSCFEKDVEYGMKPTFDENGRITLSHKELLGTWEENASLFSVGETVPGIVRSVEKYGIFVELTPNLAGLAEFSQGVEAGSHASVYIKSIIPSKMKIKLIIVDCFEADYPAQPPEYFIKEGHIDRWIYSPEDSEKVIESAF